MSAASPASLWNDQPLVLVIQGADFAAPAEARLVDPSGGVTTTSQVAVRSSSELEATFPPGLAPGSYQVAVGTSAGSSPTASAPTVSVVGNVDPDARGGHLVGWQDLPFQGASGDRPSMRVYYPALSAGLAAPIDLSRAPYPMVAYGHGFKPPLFGFGIEFRNNAFVAEWLASYGYVVACPDLATNNQLFGSGATGQANSERDADDLIAVLDELTRRSQDPADPLRGAVDPAKAALGGHSRGGDGALIAAGREALRTPRRVQAAFAFGPPSRDSQNNNVPLLFGDLSLVPLMLLGASQDAIAPLADQRAILTTTRTRGVVLEVVGGSHSLYKDNDTAILGDGAPTITLATQQAVCRRYVTAWLNRLVRGQGALPTPWLPGGAIASADARVALIDDTR